MNPSYPYITIYIYKVDEICICYPKEFLWSTVIYNSSKLDCGSQYDIAFDHSCII